MTKPVYINAVGCVSSQKSFDNSTFFDEVVHYSDKKLYAVDPGYKQFIDRSMIRRMGKGVKMGVVAAQLALNEAEVNQPDAIITGTGEGCLRDSEKFLENIIDNEEQFLTPTSFIQSTHNTVGAQIALGLQCKAYNMTYVNASTSFEASLNDARLQFAEGASNILVGGVDEIGEMTFKFYERIDHIKSDEIESLELFETDSKGTIMGEGASFFLLSADKHKNTYAELKDVRTYYKLDNIQEAAQAFLDQNNLTTSDIDAVVLGNNGDSEFDVLYDDLKTNIFQDTPQVAYKHLCGEFYTASAFGFWIGAKILKHQHIPDVLNQNKIEKKEYRHMLLYNQFKGENHSFVLLSSC